RALARHGLRRRPPLRRAPTRRGGDRDHLRCARGRDARVLGCRPALAVPRRARCRGSGQDPDPRRGCRGGAVGSEPARRADARERAERRAAHRALAEVLADDKEHADRRAWHLAASALDPDESVVRALEEAAARAEVRAAHLAASRALERAAELSADGTARGLRLVGAARAASVAAADDRAVALAGLARYGFRAEAAQIARDLFRRLAEFTDPSLLDGSPH